MSKVGPDIFRELKHHYSLVKEDIAERMGEFKKIHQRADDSEIFRELCFCILSSGVGPRIAEKSINALGSELYTAASDQLINQLAGIHKYAENAAYIYSTRIYLHEEFNFKLFNKLRSIEDEQSRRDFVADNKGIKGIGYVQASHFLRNIGFKGYAILDKNILSSLFDLGVIEDKKQPSTKNRYIEKENRMKGLSEASGIALEELDLLLWHRKTGRIPR